MIKNKLYFAKARPEAKIPSKRLEDAGYDIYACFDEAFLIIEPHQTKLIPTGLHSAFSLDYVMVLKERGSTGSKGIGQRAGIIDSGYRGEILVPLTNTGIKPLVIAKNIADFSADKYLVYPYEKAIAQALIIVVPKLEIEEINLEDLQQISSERGEGKLGDSGK
ncbi:MAG: dUTP pyrophosphatase [Patescibacteria group bacterium]|nr:dUTP pyrophosphatase [Patescibacteria group bacterium]